MSVGDVFLLVVRWLHLVAAAAWVGGSLFYLVVLRPASRREPDPSRALSIATAAEFKGLVDTSILVLVTTGVILTFNRLTGGAAGAPYVVTLGVKVALSLWMFALARAQRRRSVPRGPLTPPRPQPASVIRRIARLGTWYNTVVILGIVVFLLSDLLKVLFELALAAE